MPDNTRTYSTITASQAMRRTSAAIANDTRKARHGEASDLRYRIGR